MKRFFAILAIAALTLAGCVKNPEASLKVEGTQLCHADGTPAVFRGVSFGWHNLWPRFYNADAVAEITGNWGAPILRAAIGADNHANADNPGCHSGYIDEPELAMDCLFKVVDAAIANKKYIIVDWHSHVLHPVEAREFFTKVATRYKHSPYVIYELFNEPVCFSFEQERSYVDLGDPDAMQEYWEALKDYAEELIETITSISRTHPLILMGCPCWDQRIDLPASDPVDCYDNIMYTVHFYAGSHKDGLRAATQAAVDAGLPVFISECAACNSDGNGDPDWESWSAWNEFAARNGISMAVWSISDKDEFCSMISPEATSEGPWSDSDLRLWGKAIKNDWLQK